MRYKELFLGSLTIGLLICGLVIGFHIRSRLLCDDVEAIRNSRRRIRRCGTRPHYIGSSEDTQRKVTGVEIEGEEEARIDWEDRLDPLYVRMEEADARRFVREVRDCLNMNVECPTRNSSVKRTQTVDFKREPGFNLIQSGNSRSERFPSSSKQASPAPEKPQNEVSQSGRGLIRKVTTSNYPVESLSEWGYFDTTGYMDESGEPHVWKSRRSGEKESAYEAVPKRQITPAVKYHSYTNQYDASPSGQTNQYNEGKSVQEWIEENEYEEVFSLRSQSSTSSPFGQQPGTPPSGPTSPSPSARKYAEMKSPREHQSTASKIRSVSFAPAKIFSKHSSSKSKIPTRANSSAHLPRPVRYIPSTKYPNPNSPTSPTGSISPFGASRPPPFNINRSPTATTPLLGSMRSASVKSSDSCKTVLKWKHGGR